MTNSRVGSREAITQLMEKKNWDRRDLAVRAGVSFRTMENVLGGRNVRFQTLRNIAVALETDVSTITSVDPEDFPERVSDDMRPNNRRSIEQPKKTQVPRLVGMTRKRFGVLTQGAGRTRRAAEPNVQAIPVLLLSILWNYQSAGSSNQSSWAVKESATLKGDLGTAREKPGLGVAIVTTEIASIAFGKEAATRIDQCIAWGLGRTQSNPPYQIQEPIIDYINYAEIGLAPDFRHTLAFAVILARAHRHLHYLDAYVRLALERQQEDGGWPSDSVTTVSPVFTSFYATELLYLASIDARLATTIRASVPHALAKSIAWLMEHRNAQGLWSSTVFEKFEWDGPFTTAWVLHRLLQTSKTKVNRWSQCLDDAVFLMIRKAAQSDTWSTSSPAQRIRIEARIAAAAARARSLPGLSPRSSDAIETYLGAWKRGAEEWVSGQPLEEIDVATATFMLWGLVSERGLSKFARDLLRQDG